MDPMETKRQIFDHTIGLLQKALDLRTLRHRILSDNIANSDTPNFSPQEVPFHKVLQERMQGSFFPSLRVTHPHHLAGGFQNAVELVRSAEGIELDQEMAKLAENNLIFQATVQALVKKFDALKTVIQEGGR